MTGRRIRIVSKWLCIKLFTEPLAVASGCFRFTHSLPRAVLHLPHQKPHDMRPVVSKVTDDNQRARQNYRGISADKADLQVTNRLSKINHGTAQVVNQAINHADIEK